jgi:AAA15 family ATPase/GTPase
MGIFRRIEIRNFRSIHHLVIDNGLENINLLVGNNDIGKSNVLRALNLFFNNQTDLGKPLDFWEDFNKNIIRTSGKGQYIKIVIDIDLKYEKNKYVRWTRQWNNSGERKVNDFEVFDSLTHKVSAFDANTRAKGWLERIVFRYIPAIKSEKYFQHLFEELHDLLSTSYSEQFQKNTLALIQSIQNITEEITTELNDKILIQNRISLPNDLKAFFSALDFSIEINGQKFNLKSRGDGIKVRHIPIVLKFMSDKAKLYKKGSLDIKTIWAFEEPENNLEMTHAFAMAKSFLDYSEKIDIFITTHSPAFYSLKDKNNVSCWYIERNENNSTDAINIKSQYVDLDDKMGVLWYITPFIEQKDEELRKKQEENIVLQNEVEKTKENTKIIVFTEDESDDLSMIKTYLRLHGFMDLFTEYHSYYGKDNFYSAIVAADIMRKKRPQIEYFFFHRDMDVDGEYFKTQIESRLTKLGRKNYILVLPEGYDLESEFINAKHIHKLYDSLSIARIEELINESTEEVKDKSLAKLRERYMSVKTIQNLNAGIAIKDFKWQDMISEVDKMYFANPSRYRYGKTVIGVLKSKIQREIGSNVDLLVETEFVIKGKLKTISDSLK